MYKSTQTKGDDDFGEFSLPMMAVAYSTKEDSFNAQTAMFLGMIQYRINQPHNSYARHVKIFTKPYNRNFNP